jgi:hypothetical protein
MRLSAERWWRGNWVESRKHTRGRHPTNYETRGDKRTGAIHRHRAHPQESCRIALDEVVLLVRFVGVGEVIAAIVRGTQSEAPRATRSRGDGARTETGIIRNNT